ncbi:MAG TPA: NUDIX hydrolase [Candidatus Paceibacterota bacterium]
MEKTAYRGKIIEVVEKEFEQDGKTRTFEFARRSPGVRLIVQREQTILISREFRHEQGGYDNRLPGGKVFDTLHEYTAALDAGRDVAEAARLAAIKEAREEAGIEARNLSLFHKSVCGATIEWDLYYFIANEYDEGAQELEEGEDITTEFMNVDTVKSMCLDGSIGEERSALVLLRYLAR